MLGYRFHHWGGTEQEEVNKSLSQQEMVLEELTKGLCPRNVVRMAWNWRHCQPQPCQLPAPGGTGLTGRALQQAVLPGDGMGLGPGNLAGGPGGAQGGKRRGGRMALQRNPYQQFNKT